MTAAFFKERIFIDCKESYLWHLEDKHARMPIPFKPLLWQPNVEKHKKGGHYFNLVKIKLVQLRLATNKK